MPKPTPWYNVQAAADDALVGEVSIRGYIGEWGVNDSDFIASVEALGEVDEINVSINTRGGETDHAIGIFNYLKSHKAKVNIRVTGVAMSAGSIIAMAGDEILMPANTLMMVHNPWTYAAGSAEDFRKQAADLDKWETALRETYMARTGLDEDAIKALLDETTYMTAAEAVELGFADRVEPIGKQAHAQSAAVAFAAALSIPADVLAKIQAAEQASEPFPEEQQDEEVTEDQISDQPVAEFTADDEAPADEAEAAAPGVQADTYTQALVAAAEAAGLADYSSTFALDPKLTSPEALAQALADAREIIALSDLAGKPTMASALIRERATVDKARETLLNTVALDDESRPTDNHIPSAGHPAQTAAPKPVNTASIWAARKAACKRQ